MVDLKNLFNEIDEMLTWLEEHHLGFYSGSNDVLLALEADLMYRELFLEDPSESKDWEVTLNMDYTGIPREMMEDAHERLKSIVDSFRDSEL